MDVRVIKWLRSLGLKHYFTAALGLCILTTVCYVLARVQYDLSPVPPDPTVHLAVVMCGARFKEGLAALKSAIAFTPQNLHIHAFPDPDMQPILKEQLIQWQSLRRGSFTYTLYSPVYPVVSDYQAELRALYQPCATLRLFLPEILPLDSVLYIDSDTLVLADLRLVWREFEHFRQHQVLGASLEMADTIRIAENGTFTRNKNKRGPNTGVLLMNLTRMREVHWTRETLHMYHKYKKELVYGDQCIVAILYFLHPEWVYPLPCNWNYGPALCEQGQRCQSANDSGINILHGFSQSFHETGRNIPYFREAYKVMNKEFQLSSGKQDGARYVTLLRRRLQESKNSVCSSVYILLKYAHLDGFLATRV